MTGRGGWLGVGRRLARTLQRGQVVLVVTLLLARSLSIPARAGVPEPETRRQAILDQSLADYRSVLERLRRSRGSSRAVPPAPLFLFGMGHRASQVSRVELPPGARPHVALVGGRLIPAGRPSR
jgi:hypothetical protein